MAAESTVSLIRVDSLASDVPYAYAAVPAPGRRLIFMAGACPLNAAGEVVAQDDLVAQTTQVMANLGAALNAAGAKLDDVLKTTVFVASSQRADLATVWQVVSDRFGDHDPPSTLVGVTALGYRHQLVEVEAVASVPDFR